MARLRRARLLALSDGWPRGFTLLLTPATRDKTIASFRGDFENFMLLEKLGTDWAASWVKRSLFVRPSVKQIGYAFTAEKWVWTPRMERLVTMRQKRCVTSQFCEDAFNRIKKSVDMSSITHVRPRGLGPCRSIVMS